MVSPGCGPCESLLETLALEAPNHSPHRVVISTGTPEATRALVQQVALPADLPVLRDAHQHLRTQWGVGATPTTVVVDAQRRFVHHTVGFTPAAPQPEATAVAV